MDVEELLATSRLEISAVLDSWDVIKAARMSRDKNDGETKAQELPLTTTLHGQFMAVRRADEKGRGRTHGL